MGAEVCHAVQEAPGLDLAAAIDLGDSRDALIGADVAVDFTHPDAVMANIAWCVEHGVNAVVGTTGFTPERLDSVRGFLGDEPSVGVLIASNFAIGAVLMMHFSKLAAPYFESVEIIETHHPMKADAPSGTAATTARIIAQARAEAGCAPMPDATTQEVPGARGADFDGVRVHSLRLAGLIAHQEVHLTSAGETLTIIDDARSRATYMPGVLAGIAWVSDHKGLTMGLDRVLGL
jgi:4-hydroxy-tetrahydrodipicolinate reductase